MLASILVECKQEVICDLAEYYNIYNYKGLLPEMVATLVIGLREDSRTKMKLSNSILTLNQTLMAMQVDCLNILIWSKTKDAQKGRNKPKSILDILLGKNKEHKDDLMVFDTPEDYEKYMKAIRGQNNGK